MASGKFVCQSTKNQAALFSPSPITPVGEYAPGKARVCIKAKSPLNIYPLATGIMAPQRLDRILSKQKRGRQKVDDTHHSLKNWNERVNTRQVDTCERDYYRIYNREHEDRCERNVAVSRTYRLSPLHRSECPLCGQKRTLPAPDDVIGLYTARLSA